MADELSEEKSRCNKYETDISSLTQEVKRLELKLSAESEQSVSLKSKIKRLEEEHSRRLRALDTSSQSNNRSFNKSNRHLPHQQEEDPNKELEEYVLQLQEELELTKKELEQEREKINSFEESIQGLIDERDQEYNRLREALLDIRSWLEEKADTLELLSQKVDVEKQLKEKLKEQIKTVEVQLSSRATTRVSKKSFSAERAAIKKLEDSVTLLQNKLDNQVQLNHSLRAELDLVLSDNEKLEERIQDLQSAAQEENDEEDD